MKRILKYTIDYLSKKVPDFKIKKGKIVLFTCPYCQNKLPSANIIPFTDNIRCSVPGCEISKRVNITLFDIVRQIEQDKKDFTNEQIASYIKELLNLNIVLDFENSRILDFYEQQGFDLVPIARDQKIPIERGWPEKEHKNKKEWTEWIGLGLNLGIKTGVRSNVTVIDIDQKEIPPELKKLLTSTLILETSKGWHYIYKYEQDIPKKRIDELKVDIENDGGQIVCPPSRVNGEIRKINYDLVNSMSKELKEFLLGKLKINSPISTKEVISSNSNTSNINELKNLYLKSIEEGNRHHTLMYLGGILRKELNSQQTYFALDIINKSCCKPPLSQNEFNNVIGSFEKYITFDEIDLANKILQYLKVVEESNSRDIIDALGSKTPEGKQRVERAIKYLVKEGYLFKKRRSYHLIKRAEWKDSLIGEVGEIDFIMPYFHDYAIFRNGDMLILGAKTGVGKTHIAMNIVKRLVAQGKTPHYVSLESGSRFINIALNLGLKDGDFKYCVHFSPQDIELEEKAITIIDWLLPDDYAMTDKLYKYFAEQLVKKGGILIIFSQLRKDNDFFAKNMIDMFPSFVVKFLYENEEDNINSYFQITKIREAKYKKQRKILCTYDYTTKELKTKEELEQNNLGDKNE